MKIQVLPLENIGAEIVGLDMSKPVSDSTKDEVYAAWLKHGVLLFRGMGGNSSIQIELSKWFGDLVDHGVHDTLKSFTVKDAPELMKLDSGKNKSASYYIGDKLKSGFIFWHQDLVYTPSICRGSALRMIKVPEEGGETAWIDTVKVYDALSKEMKSRIEGLEVRFQLRIDQEDVRFGLPKSFRAASIEEAPYERTTMPSSLGAIHPLVIAHPETGAKCLTISPSGVVEVMGMPAEQGDALLRELVEFTIQPQFMYVHSWEVNDIVVWDNRRTLHSVLGHPYGQERLVHRTTLAGGMQSGRVYEPSIAAQ